MTTVTKFDKYDISKPSSDSIWFGLQYRGSILGFNGLLNKVQDELGPVEKFEFAAGVGNSTVVTTRAKAVAFLEKYKDIDSNPK